MRLTFLGTGTSQGVPMIGCHCDVCQSLDFRDKRLRTSVLVETEQSSVVIDAGPDFRQQMLRKRQKRLDAVLITHEHKDHVAGLDDVRAFNFLQEKTMPVYGLPRVLNQLKVEYAYAFAEHKYPGVPKIALNEINSGDQWMVGDLQIEAIPVMHARLPILGFRMDKLAYITDANFLSAEALKQVEGCQVLVLNALQKQAHISHYTLEEAVNLAQSTGIPRVFFIHMSHRMGRHSIISSELPSGIQLAWDGMSIEI
jgi:phosphoribosyl 1,2-cyclic phosphate phosphodiesterase